MECECQQGRHRAPTKPLSRLVLPTLLVTLLPIAIAMGTLNVGADPATQISSVDPYAGSITIEAKPLAIPGVIATLPVATPSPAEIRGTDHTSAPNGSSYRPSESATGSPVTTSTTPALPSAPGKDQQAPTASSEPLPVGSTEAANSRCTGLNSQQNVVVACNAILSAFPEIDSVIGKAVRSGNPKSCHHRGQALDLMVNDNRLGDRIMEWVKAHKQEFGIAWTGWEVPNHFDHVHLSFNPCKG
jgi:hypothetical protein